VADLDKDIAAGLEDSGTLVAAPPEVMKRYSPPPDSVGGLQPWQRPAEANPNGLLPWLVAGGAKAGEFAGHMATRHPLEIAAALYGANQLRGKLFHGKSSAAPAEATGTKPPAGPSGPPRLPAGVTTVTEADKAKFPKDLKHFEVGDEIDRKELMALKMGRAAGAPAPKSPTTPAPEPPTPAPEAAATPPAAAPAVAEAAAAERAMAPAAPEAPAGVGLKPITVYGRPGGPITSYMHPESESASGPELARRAAAMVKATGRSPLSFMGPAAEGAVNSTIIPLLPYILQLLQGKTIEQQMQEVGPLLDELRIGREKYPNMLPASYRPQGA